MDENRYLTRSRSDTSIIYDSAYELHHRLVLDPTESFGVIGGTIGYSHAGFYESMSRLVASPRLSLHHLNFSLADGNPIASESKQAYQIDGRKITVRNYKNGTIGIYTVSTNSSFPD